MIPERWAQIEELFHRAAECAPEHRTALLDEAGNDDPELRREVEALLSCQESAGDHLQAAVSVGLEAIGFPLVGETISHYHILDGLGGGGMGLVYRAEDLKLGRRVALKFLPEESAKDPVALGRFEREARSASALEHPNICPVYEFGEYQGRSFLVMQLLEGQTLRELIATAGTGNPPLGIEKLLDFGIQITAGLDAAHQKGIIHRDIKPANIFVTRQGQAKILDFGLAKLFPVVTAIGEDSEPDHGDGAETEGTPSETLPLTTPDPFLSRTGVAMGTAGYMSPEQARGEKLDARTDLFSLGLVLYEMATGQRAFKGDTGPLLHDAILKQLPAPARQLNPSLPAKLEKIIHRALEKDREARYQTASNMHADLEALKQELEPKPLARQWKVAAGAAVVLIASASIWLARLRPSSVRSPLDVKFRQLTTNSPENRVIGGAISPDGKYLAYSDLKGMHIKRMETGETRSVPQPAELEGKNVDWEVVGAWLPDGTHFLANAHEAGGKVGEWTSLGTSIWVGSVLAGPPKKLREEGVAFNISPDGSQISFGTSRGGIAEGEIWLMGPDGEGAHKFLEAEGNGSVTALNWSPDGQRIIYFEADAAGEPRGVSRALNGGPLTTIFPPSEMKQLNELVWLSDGRLIYSVPEPGALGDTCNYWARRIDLRTGARIDEPRRVTNWSGFCLGSGTATADGKRLTFLGWATHKSVYVANLEAGGTRIRNSRQFTLDESNNYPMDWTLDSKSIIFFSMRSGTEGVYRQRLDEDTPELIATAPGQFSSARVTPDGKWVVWFVHPSGVEPNAPAQLMRAPITGGSPELIFSVQEHPWSQIFCARPPSNLCAVAEPTEDRKLLIVTAFDPVKGRGAELVRFDLDPNEPGWSCQISPDGTRLAAIRGPEGPIHILSLRGQPRQLIPAEQFHKKQYLFWAADGKGLFITHGVKGGSELVHMDLRGNTKAMWKNNGGYYPWGLQSPDGRHLAIQGSSLSGNMWMMENF